MARRPEIGNVALYPDRPLTKKDRNGYVLKFYCPIQGKRIRRNCGTRDRREARKILRECRERLLNGEYVSSNGAITAEIAAAAEPVTRANDGGEVDPGPTWEDCYDRYRDHQKKRVRPRTYDDAVCGLGLSQRVFEQYHETLGISPALFVRELLTVEKLEFLQDRLLDGAFGRYESRSPNTVNSILATVMAFARFCHRRDWIHRVPPLRKLEADEVMKGRPITAEEFQRMMDAVPKVVGDGPSESWRFALRALWESGFRVGELMNFSWDDSRCIHPVWPKGDKMLPTLVIPSSQKNKRVQEIPLLPGLNDLLQSVPKAERAGWVVDPEPRLSRLRAGQVRPSESLLALAVERYTNTAIANACGVSEAAVRKWRSSSGPVQIADASQGCDTIPDHVVDELRKSRHVSMQRPTADHVSKIIVKIGRKAGVIVSQTNEKTKYASAHDLRRGCALRLIDLGVTAETLKLVMRHQSFVTTEKYYGASRSAQAAATELRQLVANAGKPELVGGLMGGLAEEATLDANELLKLKALLARL